MQQIRGKPGFEESIENDVLMDGKAVNNSMPGTRADALSCIGVWEKAEREAAGPVWQIESRVIRDVVALAASCSTAANQNWREVALVCDSENPLLKLR